MNFKAEELAEEIRPIKYLESKGRPEHFWPYYRPLGGQNLTPCPGTQYPPHPPDTKELRNMNSTYGDTLNESANLNYASIGAWKKEGSKNSAFKFVKTPRGPMGGYENNSTPVNAAWMLEEQSNLSGSTSYRGTFTKKAVSPRRRKMRPC